MKAVTRIGFTFVLGLLAADWFPLRAAEYHLAANGNDANTGTKERPFATLEKARDAVRALHARTPGEPVTVWIHGGIYRRTQPLALGRADSGARNAPVLYRAAPGETVRLSGGVPLSRRWFEPVKDPAVLSRIVSEEARRGVLAVNLKANGITEYGEITRRGFYKASERYKAAPSELYIGGKRMTLARWPNDGTVSRTRIIAAGPKGAGNPFNVAGGADPDFWDRGGTFAYAFDRPEKWKQAEDIWVDGIHSWSWEWSYNKITSINTEKKEITLRYGEVSGLFDAYSGNAFHFENLLEEIDAPGEYYIDRAKGMLYLLPPQEFDEPGVEIELTSHAGHLVRAENASFVAFRDIIFELTRGLIAIEASGGEGIRIESCEVRNCGGNGIILAGKNHGVACCHVHHIGGTGIALRGGKFETLEPGGSFAEDNEIHHFGQVQRVYSPGIAVGLPGHVGLCASRNHIHHGPHVGILTWGNDNLIEYNDIHDVVLEFTDMGAIDMNSGDRPFERGTVIRRNFIHHIGEHKPQQNGVYPDNFTMGVLIEENIFYRIGGVGRASDCRAVNVNCGSYIITRHNLLVDCSLPYCLSDHAGGALYEQTVPQWKAYFTKNQSLLPLFGKRYAELLRFWDEPRQYPESNRFERNIILNLNVPRLRAYGAKREPLVDGALDPKKVLKMAGNVAGETPAGVVAPDGKLNLTDNVFGLIPGFPRLSLSEIGPRGRVGPHPGEER